MKINNKSGVALVIVMCFTAIISLLLAVLVASSITHMKIASGQKGMEASLYVAEAGLERACSHIANGGDVPTAFSGSVGDGTYVVTVVASGELADGLCSVGGSININPNNSPDNQFVLMLPDGSSITQDDLQQGYGGYSGQATNVFVMPKGNGNQNSLVVNGQAYDLSNGSQYNIASEDMAVNLYNDHVQGGKAVGKWWISVASTGAILTEN